MVASVLEAEARCVPFATESMLERGFVRCVEEVDLLYFERALVENVCIQFHCKCVEAYKKSSKFNYFVRMVFCS